MKRVTAMKILSKITSFILSVVVMSSCAIDDVHDYTHDDYYFYPPLEGAQYYPAYGTVNGSSNVSIIATGNVFEIAGFPDADIIKYLGNAEFTVSTVTDNAIDNVLRDLIPYSYDKTALDGMPNKKIQLNIKPHTMTFRVKRNGRDVPVIVKFEPKDDDNYLMFTKTASSYSWVYSFTITSTQMIVDGVPLDDFKGTDYECRVFVTPIMTNTNT